MAFQFLGLLKILAAGGSLYKTRLDHEVTSNCNIKNAVDKTLICSRHPCLGQERASLHCLRAASKHTPNVDTFGGNASPATHWTSKPSLLQFLMFFFSFLLVFCRWPQCDRNSCSRRFPSEQLLFQGLTVAAGQL